MITPQPRLIFWTAVVALAIAILAATQSPALLVWAAVCCVSVLMVDAAIGLHHARGVNAGLPETVRLTKDRQGTFGIWIEDPMSVSGKSRSLRVGLYFPPAIETEKSERWVRIPGEDVRVMFNWECTARQRGAYAIENVYLESASPLGFWAIRRTVHALMNIRVYPNLMSEQRQLGALFLNRGMFGVHAQRQVGKGREFEKLREYIPGDSYEDISWKATARRGRPITQIFQIERTQEVYVILDMSRLSGRTVVNPDNTRVTQLERFVTAALVMGLAAEQQGDLFGVAAFDEQVRSFVRARNGKAHYGACRDVLYALEPNQVNPDFGDMFSFLRLRLRRRALLIFLTNLDDPVLAENFMEHIGLLSSHHLVLVNQIGLPGMAPVFAKPDAFSTEAVYEHLAQHLRWRALRDVERTLSHRGIAMRLVENERLCPQLVTQYVNVKRRQLL